MENEKVLSAQKIVGIAYETLVLFVRGLIMILGEIFRVFVPKQKKKVRGQVVLITGASRGLGRELALRFGKLGAIVVLWSSNETAVESVAKEIRKEGGIAHAYECDVTEENHVESTARRVISDVGMVDILVNNAGIFHQKSLIYQNSNQIRRVLDVNLLSHYWTIRQFLPKMSDRGKGQIVAVSSVAGVVGAPKVTSYCSSKFGVLGLMDALGAELYEDKLDQFITLTTICPGPFTSGLLKAPTSRFPLIFPVCSLEDVASASMDAILKNERMVTIPGRIGFMLNLSQTLLPRKVNLMWQRFFECRAGPDD